MELWAYPIILNKFQYIIQSLHIMTSNTNALFLSHFIVVRMYKITENPGVVLPTELVDKYHETSHSTSL
jgi:hypothetical protein